MSWPQVGLVSCGERLFPQRLPTLSSGVVRCHVSRGKPTRSPSKVPRLIAHHHDRLLVRYCPDGATEATKLECPAGTFSTGSSATCTRAAKGHFASEVDHTRQQPCQAGSYSDELGLAKCNTCDEDEFCPTGSIAKLPCPKHATFDTRSGMCLCRITHFTVRGVFRAEATATGSSVGWRGTLCHSLSSVDGLQKVACTSERSPSLATSHVGAHSNAHRADLRSLPKSHAKAMAAVHKQNQEAR